MKMWELWNSVASMQEGKMYHQLYMLPFLDLIVSSSFYTTLSISLDTIDDDIISNTTNFTLATGERLCFNVTIVDDNLIEYDETYRFYFSAANDSTQFYDGTRIRISGNEDNPGQKLF